MRWPQADLPKGAVAQTLGRRPRAHRRDWTARTRTPHLDALRYTRFVTVMKRALPVAAVRADRRGARLFACSRANPPSVWR